MNYSAMGQRIKKRRLEMSLTQAELAERTSLTDTYIGAIERATSKCSIETIVVIAKELNLNLDYLLLGINNSNVDTHFSEAINKLPKEKQNLFIDLCDAILEKLK